MAEMLMNFMSSKSEMINLNGQENKRLYKYITINAVIIYYKLLKKKLALLLLYFMKKKA